MKVEWLHHTGFNVSNMDQSLEFYRGLLGLEVTNEEEFASGFASKIPGLLAEFGGKALVPRNTEVSILENQVTGRQADVHAIFEFPDRGSALE